MALAVPSAPNQSVLLAAASSPLPPQTGSPSHAPAGLSNSLARLESSALVVAFSSGCLPKIPGGLSAVETLFGWGTGWNTASPGSGGMAQIPAVLLPPRPGTGQELKEDFGMGAWGSPVQALLQGTPAPKPEQNAQGHTEHLPGWRHHRLTGHHPRAATLLLVTLLPERSQNTPPA